MAIGLGSAFCFTEPICAVVLVAADSINLWTEPVMVRVLDPVGIPNLAGVTAKVNADVFVVDPPGLVTTNDTKPAA